MKRLPPAKTSLPVVGLALLVINGMLLAPSLQARPRLTLSELDRNKSGKREELFSKWMSGSDLGDHVKKSGETPLYVEADRKGQMRAISVAEPAAGYYYYFRMSEDGLMRYHERFSKEGYRILTLSEDRDDLYSAVWVEEDKYEKLLPLLKNLGISPAEVKD